MRWRWLLLVVAAWLVAVPPALGQGLTRTEAISIALAEAHRRYVVLEDYPVHIRVDDANAGRVRWARRLAKNPELARGLEGRSFWTIEIHPNYGPGVAVTGGIGLVVFVDRTSGAVLGAIRLSGEFE